MTRLLPPLIGCPQRSYSNPMPMPARGKRVDELLVLGAEAGGAVEQPEETGGAEAAGDADGETERDPLEDGPRPAGEAHRGEAFAKVAGLRHPSRS